MSESIAHSQSGATFRIVVNEEGQYSIWRSGVALPAGWRDAGISGDEVHCLREVGERWKDLRPQSVREEPL